MRKELKGKWKVRKGDSVYKEERDAPQLRVAATKELVWWG